MKQLMFAAFLALAATVSPAGSAASHAGGAPAAAAAASQPLVDAQVKRINKSSGKLTLAHGPIPNLGMGAMTMVFKLKEPAWIDQVKEGDRIRIAVAEVKGELTVTQLEPAR